MTTDNKKLIHTFQKFLVNILLPVNFQYIIFSEKVIKIKFLIE